MSIVLWVRFGIRRPLIGPSFYGAATALPSFDHVVQLLREAATDSARLGPALAAAEDLAFNDEAERQRLPESVLNALDELTDGLDLFEPRPDWRGEDAGLFGPVEAQSRIESFLSRIREGAP
ncbi:hypothetical protein [Rubrivirga sp. IMCC45206]|uniref:hypothetical protein n=1 Tax=Rubrivirga sp. IMCC45206 TaxID=3391614 RepID=UPI00398FB3D1